MVGFIVRVYQFGNIPGDINQDEAYAAYESYSILQYGMDSWGYRFPVYLVAWGSGMNALNTYLMMPLIAIFGLNTWVIRLPQLIVACFTIIVLYLLMNEISNKKIALICTGLLAISPWHIFLSRWALESNLAPGFLIFGLHFFVIGLKNNKYFIISAIMYGLSLYCYATIWLSVPLILILETLYCIRYNKIKIRREVIIAILLLSITAFPLILFMLVNMGYIEEIKLSFMSIPKLVYMRSNEVGFENIIENFKNLWGIVIKQTDGVISNSTEKYGLFYYFTLPFFFFGLYFLLKRIVIAIKNKYYEPLVFILIQLISAFLLGVMIHVNINRVNSIFIPIIIVSGLGIYWVCENLDSKLYSIIFVVYMALFLGFSKYYFDEYSEIISGRFCKGIESSIKVALQHEGTIYVSPNVTQARVLYYSKFDTKEYLDTIEWKNYPSMSLNAKSFGRYIMDINMEDLDREGIYISDFSIDVKIFEEAGYCIEKYDNFFVAYME